MKLSISNIAWPIEYNNEVYRLMCKYGFKGLEIAPGKVIKELYVKNQIEKDQLLSCLKGFNIRPVAMQSLLFGTQGMILFEDETSRQKLLQFLKQAIDWAQYFGIEALIFGSPKNRIMPDPTNNELWVIAEMIFKEIGEYSLNKGVRFCLEPNPQIYGTNFLNTTCEAIDFVKRVNSNGLFVNLDIGAVIYNKEDVHAIVNTETIKYIGHVHISEPNLVQIKEYDYQIIIRDLLKKLNYKDYISIEMVQPVEFSIDNIEIVLKKTSEIFSNSIR